MFEARMTHAALLKRLLDAVKDIVVHANFDCSSDGVSLQALDQSHAMMVSLKLNAVGFDKYRCERPLSLGISIGSLAKILKCASDDDSMDIAVAHAWADVAAFRFEACDATQTTRFRLKLMNVDGEGPGLPGEAPHGANITIPTREYKRMISDLAVFGDTMTITTQKRTVSFFVRGDVGDGEEIMHHAECHDGDSKRAVSISTDDPVSITCSRKCLEMFAKACPVSEAVTISFAEDSFILLEFVFADEQGSLCCYLAPKIDNGDDGNETK